MLDVHPPEHTPHSWRDFFIHIATIVVGLCIAVGLEQTVEAVHHHHQMRQTRERIHSEVALNDRISQEDARQLELIVTREKHNLEIMHAADTQGSVATEEPDFSWNLQGLYDSAYNDGRENGALALMPYDESAMYSDAYIQASITTASLFSVIDKIYAAKAVLHGDSLASLSPIERQTLFASTAAALGQAESAQVNVSGCHDEWQAILSGHFSTNFGEAGK
jgi:hypothetical protein